MQTLIFASLIMALISGILACLLFTIGLEFEKSKKKSRSLLLWATIFLASSFGMLEWSLWVSGYNLFSLVFNSFPLLAYFIIWLAFIIWIFEKRGERKIWIILLILLVSMVLISVKCMNCF